MKGSPLLRALIAFVLIALAGVPLWKLTRADATVVAPVHVEAAAASVTLRLTFSAPPEKAEVLHLGKVVWTDGTRATDVTKTVALAYPKEGVDLTVNVAWLTEVEGAVRLRLTDPDGEEHDQTVWGRGKIEEVVTFP